MGNQQVGVAKGPFTDDSEHALLWNGSSEGIVDLHPNGFEHSFVHGLTESYQVGSGTSGSAQNGDLVRNALLWSGTPDSVVNLHPPDFQSSTAVAAFGDFQVGNGFNQNGFIQNALLWNGTAEGVVNLHPAEFGGSQAADISDGSQVGGGLGEAIGPRALLWYGTAASVVNLHPPHGYVSSFAYGVSGDTQVGSGIVNFATGDSHALLWHGAATSFVSLHPDGFDSSTAFDVAGDHQVGVGRMGHDLDAIEHALLWTGTAESVVDLHDFLEGNEIEFINSFARGVDENGSIVGTATARVGDSGFLPYAVLWTPVPEPTTSAFAVYGVWGAMALRRRKRAWFAECSP